MTSVINNQDATISQLVVPEGIGVADNSSPSLTPYFGALAVDPTNPTAVFVGTGSAWSAVGGGISNAGADVIAVSLTASGNGGTTITGNLTVQTITTGSVEMALYQFDITSGNDQTVTGSVIWATASGALPASVRPIATLVTNSYIIFGTTTFSYAGSITISHTGTLQIQYPGTNDVLALYSTGGSYCIAN